MYSRSLAPKGFVNRVPLILGSHQISFEKESADNSSMDMNLNTSMDMDIDKDISININSGSSNQQLQYQFSPQQQKPLLNKDVFQNVLTSKNTQSTKSIPKKENLVKRDVQHIENSSQEFQIAPYSTLICIKSKIRELNEDVLFYSKRTTVLQNYVQQHLENIQVLQANDRKIYDYIKDHQE